MARDTEIKVTVLTGSEELNLALERVLYFVFAGEVSHVFQARLGDPTTMEYEMLSSHLWIAEVFNPEHLENPEGFRTAKKFAGKARTLLLFVSLVPRDFPREGPFWLTLPSATALSKKIKEVLNNPPPSIHEYQYLEKLWPLLGGGPSDHHHRSHR